jgi:hypothetical protein
MENMAKNILASMIPPEVMALITSENMAAIMIRAKAFVEQQNRIEEMLTELVENDRNRNNGKPGRRTARVSGPGDGDAASPD